MKTNFFFLFQIIQLAAVTVLADIPSNSNQLKNLIDQGKYIRRRNEGTGKNNVVFLSTFIITATIMDVIIFDVGVFEIIFFLCLKFWQIFET